MNLSHIFISFHFKHAHLFLTQSYNFLTIFTWIFTFYFIYILQFQIHDETDGSNRKQPLITHAPGNFYFCFFFVVPNLEQFES